ncbi:hypothetical protein [Streptomyces sp. XH2]
MHGVRRLPGDGSRARWIRPVLAPPRDRVQAVIFAYDTGFVAPAPRGS